MKLKPQTSPTLPLNTDTKFKQPNKKPTQQWQTQPPN